MRLRPERHLHRVVKQDVAACGAPGELLEDHVERERLAGEHGFDGGKIVGVDLLRGRLDDGDRAANVSAPAIGDRDGSSEQVTIMHDRLSEKGKVVELVSLPDEAGYLTRAENRTALLTTIDRFLAMHIGK